MWRFVAAVAASGGLAIVPAGTASIPAGTASPAAGTASAGGWFGTVEVTYHAAWTVQDSYYRWDERTALTVAGNASVYSDEEEGTTWTHPARWSTSVDAVKGNQCSSESWRGSGSGDSGADSSSFLVGRNRNGEYSFQFHEAQATFPVAHTGTSTCPFGPPLTNETVPRSPTYVPWHQVRGTRVERLPRLRIFGSVDIQGGVGNASPEYAQWTVRWDLTYTPPPDRRAPNTRLHRAKTEGRRAQFTFSSTEGRSTFQCKLDGGPWVGCRSPKAYAKLRRGRHVFRARAHDLAGNRDASPAKYSWYVT